MTLVSWPSHTVLSSLCLQASCLAILSFLLWLELMPSTPAGMVVWVEKSSLDE